MHEATFLLGLLLASTLRSDALGRTAASYQAEIRFLRTQLRMLIERGARPRRASHAERIEMVLLSMLFDWQHSLFVIVPGTLMRWRRQVFRTTWTWITSTAPRKLRGRPPIPLWLQAFIARLAAKNALWTPQRIASELRKIGVRIAVNTVRKYHRQPVLSSVDLRGCVDQP